MIVLLLILILLTLLCLLSNSNARREKKPMPKLMTEADRDAELARVRKLYDNGEIDMREWQRRSREIERQVLK